MTAAEAAERALGRAPRWVGNLLSFRNRLVPLVSLSATADTRHSDLVASLPLERDAFRRNRKGDSFFCANQIHHSGR
nr:DUF2867 domain-containing protein [Sinorhizobium meliloti]